MVDVLTAAGYGLALAVGVSHGRLHLRLRRQRAEQDQLERKLMEKGIRAVEGFVPRLEQHIHDDCLRRGYDLHAAQFIAKHAADLGGGAVAIQSAEKQWEERNDRSRGS